MRQQAGGRGLRRRMLESVVPAVIGAVIGYVYARTTLDQEAFDRYVAMYGAAGAAIGILALRLTVIFRSVLTDYFGKAE